MAFVLGWGYFKPRGGFRGLCCSDGVKDHFGLVLVVGCNTAGESVLRSMSKLPAHNAYGFRVERTDELTETSSRRIDMEFDFWMMNHFSHIQICCLYEGSFFLSNTEYLLHKTHHIKIINHTQHHIITPSQRVLASLSRVQLLIN